MSVIASAPPTTPGGILTHDALMGLREETIAKARGEIEALMLTEGRTEHTYEEMRRLCPTPPVDPHKECSSVSSVSSEEEEEDVLSDDEADPNKPPAKRWKLKGPVMNWGETRRAHIDECFHIFCSEGFMYYDEIASAMDRVLLCILHVVNHTERWSYTGYMASPAFWACIFVMDSYSRRPGGYEVRNKDQNVLDHAQNAWTLDNMHKVLGGEKSTSFRDRAQSQEYETSVGNNSGRRHGFSRMVTRSDLKLRKLGVHNLGADHRVRVKKMRTLLALMEAAGLDRPHERICEMKPPDTHKLRSSNSAREKAMKRIEGDWDVSTQGRGDAWRKSRHAMLGAKCSVKQINRAPSPIKMPWHRDADDSPEATKMGDGTFSKAAPNARVHADDGEAFVSTGPAALPSDDEEDKKCEADNVIANLLKAQTAPVATPKTMPPLDTSKPASTKTPSVSSKSRKSDKGPKPEQATAVEEARQAATAAPEASIPPSVSELDDGGSDSSELSDSEYDDASSFAGYLHEGGEAVEGQLEGDGPHEETGDEVSELSSMIDGETEGEEGEGIESDSDDDMAFINANQQQAASAQAHEQAQQDAAEDALNSANKLKELQRSESARLRHKAINDGLDRTPLTKEELRLLEWRDALDPELLKQGIIQKLRKKRVTPFHILMRKRQEEADKSRRRDQRRKMRDARQEIKNLQAIERAENKEEVRKRINAEIAAKAERRVIKDRKRVERANHKINTSIKKCKARATVQRDKTHAKAKRRLEVAHKYQRSTLAPLGGSKFTLFMAPPKPEKPIKVPNLPRRDGYAAYGLTVEQQERLDKHGIETPLQQPDPYKRIALELEPKSNCSRPTRNSAALEKRQAALKREREAAAGEGAALGEPPGKCAREE